MDMKLIKDSAVRLTKGMIDSKFELTAIHPYTNKDGEHIYWKLRFAHIETKEKIIRPMRLINDKWELKEPEFQDKKPLYNLHLLSTSDEIYFVEGEACADALCNLGITTTTSGSATSHDRADFEPLRNKSVCIWADNDQSGFDHAQAVANKLLSIDCKVEMVDIKAINLPPKGDVIDWINENPGVRQDNIRNLKKDSYKNNYPVLIPNSQDHLGLAMNVIAVIGKENLIHTKASLWNWSDSGVWKKSDDREIKQVIHSVSSQRKITASLVASILDLIKTETYIPGHEFDIYQKSINCLNGELVFDKGSWTLQPHERTHYLTTQICTKYDPVATAPRFSLFLEEIFQGDEDKHEKISVLLEAIGYTLIPTAYLEKFFMLIGSGANGKSVLLSVLTKLIGLKNVSAVQPEQFEHRFQRAHLQGKLANIITEIKEGGQIADAQLKSLVSGEMTTAEYKFKDAFEFIPFATHWFGTNHMPHTRDFTDALFRRVVILAFNNKFEGESRDVHLIGKLESELPGILNMALEGLSRLYKNNSFTQPSSSTESAQAWLLEADQVSQFVADSCILDPNLDLYSYEIYRAYQDWAKEGGIRMVLTQKTFTTRLKNLGCTLGRGVGGNRKIVGIAFRIKIPF